MMGDWQDWIVALIVALCFIRVGLSVWNQFQRSRSLRSNPCDSCPQPCDVKRLYDKKLARCEENKKKTKNSCCE